MWSTASLLASGCDLGLVDTAGRGVVHAGGAAGLVPPSRAAAAGAKAEAAEPRGVGGAQEVGVAVSGGAVEAAAAAAVELGDGSLGTTAGCSVGGWQGRPARLGGDGDRWSGDGERVLTEGSDGPLPGGGDGNVAGDAGATYSGVLSVFIFFLNGSNQSS